MPTRKKLDPKEAEKIMLKAGLKPLEPYKALHYKWKCRCSRCKSIVSPRLKEVIKGGSGCWTCGQIIKANKRKVPQATAIEVMMKVNLKPLEPYKNGASRWKCKCLNCGKTIYPRYGDIQKGGKGCQSGGRKRQGLKKRLNESEVKKVKFQEVFITILKMKSQ